MFGFINQLFLDLLVFLADFFNGNIGFAIIALTLIIRSALIPITVPALRSQRKLSALKPELDKLKKKYGHDKQLFSKKQLELYKQKNINPAAGCLPQLVQLGILIVLYRVLINSLNSSTFDEASLNFFWLNLNQPDKSLILPILAGASQFILGIMLLPGADTKAEQKLATQTKSKKDDQKASDMTQMAQSMQSQMVYIMPVFTIFLAFSFPSGLALYWVTTTIYSLVQQYFISGLGGLKPHLSKIRLSFNK